MTMVKVMVVLFIIEMIVAAVFFTLVEPDANSPHVKPRKNHPLAHIITSRTADSSEPTESPPGERS